MSAFGQEIRFGWVVKNALATIAEEMGLSVVRSAYSSMVKEAGESTAAVFDGEGRLLAKSPGAPLSHLASQRPSLQFCSPAFPPSGWRTVVDLSRR